MVLKKYECVEKLYMWTLHQKYTFVRNGYLVSAYVFT